MQKILQLSANDFLTGIAPSSQMQGKGLFHKAVGINPVRDLFGESENIGLLQAGPTPTDITSIVITEIPWAWATDVSGVSTENLYIWGNGGTLYRKVLTDDTTIVNVNVNTTAVLPAQGASANGCFVFKHSNGDKCVYMMMPTAIYRYDITANDTISNEMSGLQSSSWHPTHRFFDRVYYGNGQYIGYVEDDGSGGLAGDKCRLGTKALPFSCFCVGGKPKEYSVNQNNPNQGGQQNQQGGQGQQGGQQDQKPGQQQTQKPGQGGQQQSGQPGKQNPGEQSPNRN